MYNPVDNSWTSKANYPFTAAYATAFQLCNQVFVTGDNYSSRVYRYTLSEITISGPSFVCTSETYSASGGPYSWSSDNTGILTINSSGVASRVGNASGQVTISSASQCSIPLTKTIWVGIPTQPGPISGNTTPSVGSIYQYTSSYGSTGAASYDWLLPYYGNPVWSVSGGSNTLTLNAMVGSSSGNVQVFGQNVCGNSGASRLRVFPQGGPCITCPRIAQDNKSEADTTFAKIALYPNPANTELKVRLRAPAEQEGKLSLMDFSCNVKRNEIIQKGTQWITIGTSDIFPGMYVIKINDGSKEYYRKVLVQH